MRVLLDEQLPRHLAVLRAPSNAIEDLLPLVPAALKAIKDVRPGLVMRVEA